MATRTRYVRTSAQAGGDGTTDTDSGGTHAYQTLAAALTAQAGDLGGDDLVVICSVGSGSAADTSLPDVTGFSNGTVTLQAKTDEEATGTWSDTKYRLRQTGSGAASMIDITDAINVTITRLQIEAAHASSGGDRAIHMLTATTGTVLIDGCHLRFTGSIIDYTGIYLQTTRPYKIRNTLVEGFPTFGIRHNAGTAGNSAFWHNNTVANCATGYSSAGTNPNAKNCLATACTTDWSGSFNAGSDYNAGEDGTAPGANSNPSATFTFVGATFQPAAADTGAKGEGTDLSADGNLAVTVDITAAARSVPFDIGAYLAEASAGGGGDPFVTIQFRAA